MEIAILFFVMIYGSGICWWLKKIYKLLEKMNANGALRE